MKVLLATPYFETHGGGVEIVAGRLARGLARDHGMSVTWYAGDCDPVPPAARGLQLRPVACINVIERLTGLPFPFWTRAALRTLAAGIANADVVHVHELAYPSSQAAARLARHHGVPLVLTQHTGVVRATLPLAGRVHECIEQRVAPRLFQQAAAVVFVSETSRRHAEARCGALPNAQTLWNGVEVPALPAASARAIGPRARVLFVGRRVRKKGLGILRTVAAARPQVDFLVAGRGPVDPARWGLANVQALGHVDAQALDALYRQADLLLLPSYSEGFPLVVQEALVRGLRVLSTDEVAAACPPMARHVLHCPVPTSDDPRPWLAALDSALSVRESPESRLARAREAAALWSWGSTVLAYAAIVERAVRSFPARERQR